MIYNLYVVRDIKSGYTAPMLDLNDESAIRNFKDSCLNVKLNPSMFYNPSDYSLYCVGSYDTETGIIQPLQIPRFLEDAYKYSSDRDYTPFIIYKDLSEKDSEVDLDKFVKNKNA